MVVPHLLLPSELFKKCLTLDQCPPNSCVNKSSERACKYQVSIVLAFRVPQLLIMYGRQSFSILYHHFPFYVKQELTSHLKAPVVFAHNDLLCGNIMVDDDEGICASVVILFPYLPWLISLFMIAACLPLFSIIHLCFGCGNGILLLVLTIEDDYKRVYCMMLIFA